MGWKNYGWVATIRGVESHERNVLWYLADMAGEDGIISSARISKISERSETPRRRLFQILADIEAKGFLERDRRVWSKKLGQPIQVKQTTTATLRSREIHVLGKGLGKQLPTGYRLRKDRLFPINSKAPNVWQQVKRTLADAGTGIEGQLWRVYIEAIRETYYVTRTQNLCVLVLDLDHKRWFEREARPHILKFGPDLKPHSVRVLTAFPRPNLTD